MISLDSIASVIRSDDFMLNKAIFDVLGNFTPEEVAQNKFIGINRSKVVIDYLVKHQGSMRTHFRIVDLDEHNAWPTPEVAICATSSLPY